MQKRVDLYTHAEPPFDSSTTSELRRRAEHRRLLAQALLKHGTDTEKVYSHGHGIAKLAAGALAGLIEGGGSSFEPKSGSKPNDAAYRRRLAAALLAAGRGGGPGRQTR